MIFERVAACTGGAHHVAHGHAALIVGIVQNFDSQFRQVGEYDFFALTLTDSCPPSMAKRAVVLSVLALSISSVDWCLPDMVR